MTRAGRTAAALSCCLIVMGGCENVLGPAPTVISMVLAGDAPRVGTSSQFTATASFSNGAVTVVSSASVWTTTDPLVATVTNSGVVTGVSPGSVTVRATYRGSTAGRSFPVLPATD